MKALNRFIPSSVSLPLLLLFSLIRASGAPGPKPTQIPTEIIRDKIRGGLLGQMLGNLNGLPYEFKYIREAGNLKNYIPSLPNGAVTDDDTDFEWVYIYTMQKKRTVFLPYDEVTALWKERINRNIWCSNRYARHLMDIDVKPPMTGFISLNPWAEFNVSGQFLCETFGLLAPAMPQTASKIGLHYTKVAIDNEPAQTTQLFTAMIATAFVENDIQKILDAGIASIDPASNTLRIIRDVQGWHRQHPTNWPEARRLLLEKYTREDHRTRDRNGTELNTGAIIMALLYGEGDFAETLKLSFNLGWDADCNAATLGTILGAMHGYRKMLNEGWQIVDRYKNTTRDKMPMDETITSFADRLIELFELVNETNGGRKTVVDQVVVYEIPAETPAPVQPLASLETQKAMLQKQYEKEITNALLSGTKEQRARAAYLAVCLDMDKTLRSKHPKEWEQARYELSGYWRVMNNIFFGDFTSLHKLKDKFVGAGFKKPLRPYTDQEVYGNVTVWKDPGQLYTN
ncbi:ADP-ribosylglycohydrolase family protein [Larkinella sp. VNQ87]|uniref:ADP-ribosylglycohydrolase family protein n=1 Tax=Larkinella sp. VNQ87 TaxID=3400921 RepID=UPI003C08F8CE